jgi:phosphatidylserine/phosphatidylglycerophosphate/cardiolipin synthase-like enzyme
VRVILDAVGSLRTHRSAARALRAAGAQMRVFMPLRHSPIRGRTNLRSHRKIAVMDGEVVFAGGMNLANEHMGPPSNEGTTPRWRDVVAVVKGPVAADAAALFESDWVYCGGSRRPANDRTGVIDRLVAAKLVRRVADPRYRRRVVVELLSNPRREGEIARLFEPMGTRINGLVSAYSRRDRATIADFLTKASEILEEETTRLRATP